MSEFAIEPDARVVAQLFDDAVKTEIDPFVVFETWLEDAISAEINDPIAAAIASADASGLPDVRMALMNAHDRRGLVFFTNFNSAKGQQMQANPQAAILFHWKSLRRQVRFRGPVEQVSNAEADAYFATRPRMSRIGAHASNQSQSLASRAELVARAEALETQFGDNEVPRPAHWSGFRIKPIQIEFWQDGAFRLHDRVKFTRKNTSDSVWTRMRLNP